MCQITITGRTKKPRENGLGLQNDVGHKLGAKLKLGVGL